MWVRLKTSFDWNRVVSGVATLVALLAVSVTLQALAPREPVVRGAQIVEIEASLGAIVERGGAGAIWGVLGGFRSIVADMVFLRSYVVWEESKLAEYDALGRLAVSIDPRPEIFWRYAATTLAFDMPVWRIRQTGGENVVPIGVQTRIRTEQMERAVAFLQEGRELFPDASFFPIEMGKIVLTASGDHDRAAELFLAAWEMEDAPPFIGRLLSRVLESAGRIDEALALMRADLDHLDPDDPESFIPLVHQRIAELEALTDAQ